MEILVLQFGAPWYAIASTTLVKGLLDNYPNARITWATSSENYPLFQYNKSISDLCVGLSSFRSKYDIAINLDSSQGACEAMSRLGCLDKRGFFLESGAVDVYDPAIQEYLGVFVEGKKTSRSCLQMISRLAGLKWKGWGYDLSYYPRNKTKKRKTGVAISNGELRQFVKDNLKLDYSEIWHVPMRKDLLKRIDEINRVKCLITDDLFSVHAAIALRKHVEFVDTGDHNMEIEFFGQGNRHRITT